MEIPKGFDGIVKLVMKEPAAKISGPAVWDKFVQAALIGGRRSEADINLLVYILQKKGLLKLEIVNRLSGEMWGDEVSKVLKAKLEKTEEDEEQLAISNFLKELFRITASVKGSARFFERRHVIENIDELTSADEKTWELVEEIAEDEDISNIKYTKVILWLHSIGRGKGLVPATRQVKSFINTEIGPYYPYYEDDKYFMKKGHELTDEVKKKVKNATAFDASRAIFYYSSMKSMVPRGFGKSFTPARFLDFMKKNKLTIKRLSEMLGDKGGRHRLMELVNKFARS